MSAASSHRVPCLSLVLFDVPLALLCRSILTAVLDGVPYVLVGMGDGHLVTLKLQRASDRIHVVDKRRIALGTQPVTLTLFQNQSRVNVFAACDRPTVVSVSGRKLLLSNVNVQQVTYMSPFNTPAFPDSVALASAAGLSIGT